MDNSLLEEKVNKLCFLKKILNYSRKSMKNDLIKVLDPKWDERPLNKLKLIKEESFLFNEFYVYNKLLLNKIIKMHLQSKKKNAEKSLD
jgi:hypothetical protein